MELSRRSFIAGVLAAFVAPRAASAASAPTVESSSGLRWDDPAATPLADIRAAKRLIEQQTGFAPNCLLFGAIAWAEMLEHYQIGDAEAREVATSMGLDVSIRAT